MEGLTEVVYPKDLVFFSRGHVMGLYCTSNRSRHYALQMLQFHAFTIRPLSLGFAYSVCDR